MIDDPDAFIRANTRLLSPPHVPELNLHLADDAVALWQLTEEQLGELGLPPPFWAFAWAGGQALARYILDNPNLVAGRTVWDVASGSGLVAVAAMRAGALRCTAYDIDPFAAVASRINAEANGVTLEAATHDVLGQRCDADVVLVGDLFYDRDIADRLINWLKLLGEDGRTVLVGDPGRTYLPRGQLTQVATYEVPVSRALEDAEVKRTGVWALRAQAAAGPL